MLGLHTGSPASCLPASPCLLPTHASAGTGLTGPGLALLLQTQSTLPSEAWAMI